MRARHPTVAEFPATPASPSRSLQSPALSAAANAPVPADGRYRNGWVVGEGRGGEERRERGRVDGGREVCEETGRWPAPSRRRFRRGPLSASLCPRPSLVPPESSQSVVNQTRRLNTLHFIHHPSPVASGPARRGRARSPPRRCLPSARGGATRRSNHPNQYPPAPPTGPLQSTRRLNNEYLTRTVP